jgi:hypothetical protein
MIISEIKNLSVKKNYFSKNYNVKRYCIESVNKIAKCMIDKEE